MFGIREICLTPYLIVSLSLGSSAANEWTISNSA